MPRLDEWISSVNPARVFWLFFVAGGFFRLRDYLFHRSFWLDEALLANNIRLRDFSGLMQPLDDGQVAPIGFLWLEKALFLLTGPGELSLRALPFLCGVFALPICYLAVRKLFDNAIALTSLGLMAFSYNLIFYSNELKQYSSDVFCAVTLLLLFAYWVVDSGTNRQFFFMGLSCGAAIWFSNVSVIVIFTLAIVWLISSREQSRKRLILPGMLWATPALISFGYYYTRFIHGHPGQSPMEEYWSSYFVPVSSVGEWAYWTASRAKSYFQNSLAFGVVNLFVAVPLLMVGFMSQWKEKDHGKVLLLLPLLVHYLLALLHIYPWDSRMLLYSFPFSLLFIGIGMVAVGKRYQSKLLIVAVFVILTSTSLLQEALNAVHPRSNENLRPVLEAINARAGQRIYVYASAYPAFSYYQPSVLEDIPNDRIIRGQTLDKAGEFEKQLAALKGETWFVFSHPFPPMGISTIDSLVQARRLPVLDSIHEDEARAFLVDIPETGLYGFDRE